MGIHRVLGCEVAKRFIGKRSVADACAGAGFMSICLAEVVPTVIAVDTNAAHIEFIRANADIAGVADRIQCVLGDVLDSNVQDAFHDVDAIHVDPEWALPGHWKGDHITDIGLTNPPVLVLLKHFLPITQNVAIRLPKEIDFKKLAKLPAHECELSVLGGKPKCYTLYFGDLIRSPGMTVLDVPVMRA